MLLESELIKLRPITKDDLADIVAWRSTPEAYASFFSYTPLNMDLQLKWYEKQLTNPNEQNFIIEQKELGIPIGMIGLVDINHQARSAEWGRIIVGHPDHLRKGYGVMAIELVMEYAFDHLNLKRLSCTALESNKKVITMYARMGFVEEGRLRSAVFKGGRYLDIILFSMLDDEFKERQRARNKRSE